MEYSFPYKSINHMKTSHANRISRDPSVDWIFMLSISLVAVCIFVAIWVFYYIDVGTMMSSKSATDISSAKK